MIAYKVFTRAVLRALCSGVLLFSAACRSVGPDYIEPQVQWLESWETELYGQFQAQDDWTSDSLEEWWTLFDDPTLDALIEVARVNNPDLRIAGLRVLESRASLDKALGQRYPQRQQATGSLTYINSQTTAGDQLQDLTEGQLGVVAGWELDFWGRFRRGIESADATFFSSIANQRDAQVLLYAGVADLYFAYRTAEQRIHIAHENARIQKRSYDITSQLFASGQDSELDLQQAKSQYLATLATIPALEITLRELKNGLCVVLGRAPGNLPELSAEVGPLPSLAKPMIEGIPANLLLRRPDVRSSAFKIAAQSARIGIAQSDLYPRISLIGSIGLEANDQDNSDDVIALAVGPSVTWNILNYGRIKSTVRVQDARLQIAIEDFQKTVLTAAKEIDDAAITVVKTRAIQQNLRDSLQAARRSLELANKRYQEGYADFQRVLDAQRAVAAQSDSDLINQGRQITAVINLYRSIGGGWTRTAVDNLIPGNTRMLMEERSDWSDLIRKPLPKLPAPISLDKDDTTNE